MFATNSFSLIYINRLNNFHNFLTGPIILKVVLHLIIMVRLSMNASLYYGTLEELFCRYKNRKTIPISAIQYIATKYGVSRKRIHAWLEQRRSLQLKTPNVCLQIRMI